MRRAKYNIYECAVLAQEQSYILCLMPKYAIKAASGRFYVYRANSRTAKKQNVSWAGHVD